MKEKRTSIFENGLIWFGAGVSLAEILTGTASCTAWIPERYSGNHYRSHYRMYHVIPGRCDRR